jgi:hypothetical protein
VRLHVDCVRPVPGHLPRHAVRPAAGRLGAGVAPGKSVWLVQTSSAVQVPRSSSLDCLPAELMGDLYEVSCVPSVQVDSPPYR